MKENNLYYQMETTNKSFIDMYLFLKSKGWNNNKSFLILLDPDLAGVDPFDTDLSDYYKRKIINECRNNYWYFLREIVRIPDQEGKSSKFKLNNVSYILSYLIANNITRILDLNTRQSYARCTFNAYALYKLLFNSRVDTSDIALIEQTTSASSEHKNVINSMFNKLPNFMKVNGISRYIKVKALPYNNNINRINGFNKKLTQQILYIGGLPFIKNLNNTTYKKGFYLDQFIFINCNIPKKEYYKTNEFKFMKDLIDNAVRIDLGVADIINLKESIKNNSANGFVLVNDNYNQNVLY